MRNKRKKSYPVRRFVRMFGCDAARIADPCGNLFLILGWKRRSEGEWFDEKGNPVNFDYLHENVVAHGTNMRELDASAREYKRLLTIRKREERSESLT